MFKQVENRLSKSGPNPELYFVTVCFLCGPLQAGADVLCS